MSDENSTPSHVELTTDQLRWKCDPETLPFKNTDELETTMDIIGQERALSALRMAFDINSLGYNIFVTGKIGTGRKTAIKRMINESSRLKTIPGDKLYVHSFKNTDTPRLIRLPASKGRSFKHDMEELIELLLKQIPEVFESDNYHKSRKSVIDDFKKTQKSLLSSFEKRAAGKGFAMIQIQVGNMTRPIVVPMKEGKPINPEEMRVLLQSGEISAKKHKEMEKEQEKLTGGLEEIFKQLAALEKDTGKRLKQMDFEFAGPIVSGNLDEIRGKYVNEKVKSYLDEVQESIMENLDIFRHKGDGENSGNIPPPHPGAEDDPFLEYRVNLLVDNFDSKQAPVIHETSPTYNNLFGSVEITADRRGRSSTDFTRIKAGSLLKADGGFLIIDALDLLLEPGVWPSFKRMLRNQRLEIMNYSPLYPITISGLKPEPIRIDVKVALVGDPELFRLLYNRDADFKKVFKLKADFDSVMELNQESIMDYARFARSIAEKESLHSLDRSAVARIVEYGVKLSGNRQKLSTQFNDVADLIRESDYWVRESGHSRMTGADVETAIQKKQDRSRLMEEKIREMMENGTIMIDLSGHVKGQVNGLSVYDMGDTMFGKPSRITAEVSVGSAGIINIEREAELSGRIHDKGVLILSGFMRSRFAQDKPLSVSASLCFEQSYGGVDGDSASSTEIYALMSALSEVPIHQGIAVTGSVNQKGEIQPIGGVNEKIEGFFEICRAKGLTGEQGVMIPHQNIPDLMLKNGLLSAVENGDFHIWPVKTIDQGLEILTGKSAGTRNKDGSFPEGSINERVNRKLQEFALKWKEFSLTPR